MCSFQSFWMKIVVALVVAFCHATFATFAFAESAAVAVAEFRGAKPVGLRQDVVKILEAAGYRVVSDSETPKVSSDTTDSEYVELARAGEIRAFVGASTAMGKPWTMTLTVRDGSTGKQLGSAKLDAPWYPGLRKALEEKLLAEIGGLLEQAKAPRTEQPEMTPAPALSERAEPSPKRLDREDEPESASTLEDAAEASPTEPESEEFTALELDLGPLFVQRIWSVSDDLGSPLDGRLAPEHRVSMMGARVEVLVYPAGFSNTQSFVRHIGLNASLARSFLGETTIEDATEEDQRDTVFQEVILSLRGRIPLGKHSAGVFGGVGMQSLTIAGEKRTAAQPDLQYEFVRGGADFRLQVTPRVAATLGVAYRQLLGVGDASGQLAASEWFPEASGSAVDVLLASDYAVTDALAIRFSASAVSYGLDFNQTPESISQAASEDRPAPPVAGGASDLNLSVCTSLVFLLK